MMSLNVAWDLKTAVLETFSSYEYTGSEDATDVSDLYITPDGLRHIICDYTSEYIYERLFTDP